MLLVFVFHAFLENQMPQGSSLGRIYVSAFGFMCL
jgi:hypothetical protein